MELLYPQGSAAVAADTNLPKELENGDRYASNFNRPLIGSRVWLSNGINLSARGATVAAESNSCKSLENGEACEKYLQNINKISRSAFEWE
jgi:hypothetical protein